MFVFGLLNFGGAIGLQPANASTGPDIAAGPMLELGGGVWVGVWNNMVLGLETVLGGTSWAFTGTDSFHQGMTPFAVGARAVIGWRFGASSQAE